ncbi:uncharacterized protein A1O9_01670 [Exophiala aquamarina CBS 119918]|uniref:Uncharacterized protein n=1 Tax=Exophiala aquamarina CBS 119918 TaxID=1182545 RepID=A0A072PVB7_9EURO|nr:uncharacterized protein A1O9_01670 [Exophiala aquamarina CBS 119918]KEF63692.1 hypothetical protein A1O9_01670 [Exophiala aquamarina CBS 119918]
MAYSPAAKVYLALKILECTAAVVILVHQPLGYILKLLYQVSVFIVSPFAPLLHWGGFCLAYLAILILIVCFVGVGLLVCVFPNRLRRPKEEGYLSIIRGRASSIKHAPRIHDASDVYHTAFLLKQAGLPGDVIPTILDYAELWFSTPLAASNRELEICSRSNGRIFLTAELPRALPKGSIRTLSFTIHSKDLIKHVWHHQYPLLAPNELSGFALSVFPDDTVSRPDNDRTLFPPKRLMNNHHSCHSCHSYFAYELQWHYLSKDEDIAEILNSLVGGQKLALMMCADKEAACAVKFARISCEMAAVRKM